MDNIDLILEKVKKVWKANPELRLGQLLCQVANYGALYYSTNDDIIKLLEQKYNIDLSTIEIPTAETKKNYYRRKMPQNKGRIYIHNKEGKIKAVFYDDLDSYLNNGWKLGRKELD